MITYTTTIIITSNDIADDIIIVIQHVELFKACDTPGPNSTNYLCWNTPRRWQGCGVSTFNELQMMCNVLGYLIHLYTTDFLSPQSRSVYTHLLCVSKKYPSDVSLISLPNSSLFSGFWTSRLLDTMCYLRTVPHCALKIRTWDANKEKIQQYIYKNTYIYINMLQK